MAKRVDKSTALAALFVVVVALATQAAYVVALKRTEAAVAHATVLDADGDGPGARVDQAITRRYAEGLRKTYSENVTGRLIAMTPRVFAPGLLLLALTPLVCVLLSVRTRRTELDQLVAHPVAEHAVRSATVMALGYLAIGLGALLTDTGAAWHPERLSASASLWLVSALGCIPFAGYVALLTALIRRRALRLVLGLAGLAVLWSARIGLTFAAPWSRWLFPDAYEVGLLDGGVSALRSLAAYAGFAGLCVVSAELISSRRSRARLRAELRTA